MDIVRLTVGNVVYVEGKSNFLMLVCSDEFVCNWKHLRLDGVSYPSGFLHNDNSPCKVVIVEKKYYHKWIDIIKVPSEKFPKMRMT